MDPKAMFKIGYGLYVLTARDGEKDNGCIINTLLQVTETPNRIALCVNKQSYTHDMIADTGLFNISMLTEEAPFSLFQRFGYKSGRTTDKFADFDAAVRSRNGIYYISAQTNVYLSGSVTSKIDLNTHTLFLADVTDGDLLSDAESVTYSYYQRVIKPKPQRRTEAKRGFRCRICGYVYEGDTLPDDFICPICKHGASAFERIEP